MRLPGSWGCGGKLLTGDITVPLVSRTAEESCILWGEGCEVDRSAAVGDRGEEAV